MRRRPLPVGGAGAAAVSAGAEGAASGRLFLSLLGQQYPGSFAGARALDLGCGPEETALRFLQAHPQASCEVLDGSPARLEPARAALGRLPGLAPRCRLLCEGLPSPNLPAAHYDPILSNGLLHRLDCPGVLWQTVRETAGPGARVLVMDLMRPASAGWVEALVQTYADDVPEAAQDDYRQALFAAFEPQEVAEQLAEAGLEGLEVAVVSDRHLAVFGRL